MGFRQSALIFESGWFGRSSMTLLGSGRLPPTSHKAPIECKYQTPTGWALIDSIGTVKAWHWLVPGDPRWGDLDGAIRAFPTSRIANGVSAAGGASPATTANYSTSFSQANSGATDLDDVRN